jgi:hypothetical protein
VISSSYQRSLAPHTASRLLLARICQLLSTKHFLKYVTRLGVVTWELCNIFDLLERPWKSCRSLNGGFMEVKYLMRNKSTVSVPNILEFCKQYLVTYLNESLGADFLISRL